MTDEDSIAHDVPVFLAALKTLVDADCLVGKHRACAGYTYVETPDGDTLEVPCACACHQPEAVG